MSNLKNMYSFTRLFSKNEQSGKLFYSSLKSGGKLKNNDKSKVFVNGGVNNVVNRRCMSAAASKWAGPVSEDHVLSSPHGKVDVPDHSVTDYIFQHLQLYPDKPAITCGTTGRTYTYGTCQLMIHKFAMSLLSKVGMEAKETIAIVLPNMPEFAVAINGAMEARLQVTFANPLYTEEELLRQFNDCEVKAIITVGPLLEKCLAVAKKLRNYKATVVCGQEELEKDGPIYGLKPLIMNDFKSLLPPVNLDDVAIIPYSSGTTGLPKGVMLTHKNLVVNLMQIVNPTFYRPNSEKAASYKIPHNMYKDAQLDKEGNYCLPGNHDVILTVPPYFHIYGYNGILNYNMRIGNHVVSIPRFTPEDYLACLRKYKPLALFVVPSLLTFLATHPMVKKEDLESIKHIVVGAAPTTESIVEKFLTKCGKTKSEIRLQQGFGMTECSPVATLSPYVSPHSKVTSVGQLVNGTEGRIVSLTDGKNLESNHSGELYIRGPQVMKGYLNNPAATAETLDKDGWLHTGDVAYYDDDHFFYIVDRTKELIKVKGNQVSPTELESVIMEMPSVADAAVVAVPDPLAGELPKAFVVLKADSKTKTTEEDVYDWVKEKVVKYKRLDGGVVFINAIPRNPAGKIMRMELKVLGGKQSS